MTHTSAANQRSESATAKTIRPFQANVPEADLADLRRGIQATRRIPALVITAPAHWLPSDIKSMRIIWCFVCLLFCSANAFGQNVLWDIVEDVSGGIDVMRAITLSTRSAVVIGNAENPAADVHDFVIQSLRRKNGSVRWTDRVQEAPGFLTSLQIASFQGRVFASGYTSSGLSGTDIVVRAYDALQGTLLWNSVWDSGRDDLPQAIVAGPTAVVVVGYGGNTPGHALNFIVRAYDPKSGAVLWEDRVERTDLDAAAWAVAITRNRVFVAGNTINQTNARDLLVRAYNISSGALVWETTRPSTSPTEIKASGGRVFLAGLSLAAGSSSSRSYVGVWDARSGALLWEDESTESGVFVDIAVKGDRVVAAGSSQSALLVRAYDVRDGRMEWQDQTSCPPGFDFATGVALNDRAVYVVGGCAQDFVYSEMLVRSYAANDGTLLWEDRSHRTLGASAVDVALGRNRLFVAGSESKGVPGGIPLQNFVVRAYDIQADGEACRSERSRSPGESPDVGRDAEREDCGGRSDGKPSISQDERKRDRHERAADHVRQHEKEERGRPGPQNITVTEPTMADTNLMVFTSSLFGETSLAASADARDRRQ